MAPLKPNSVSSIVGLEHALAKADFLNAPDIVLVQAFALFSLCRSPTRQSEIRVDDDWARHQDGPVPWVAARWGSFQAPTPFEVEMRRRVWCILCMLDIRSSEDQGTDLTIAAGSFDTKIPLNINECRHLIPSQSRHP